jgi:large conductance mechanosensitive channel
MWNDFKAFILRGNVVDLAVAVIIGASFGGVVKSLVDDVLMPPLGMALGHIDFTNLYVLLSPGAKSPPPYASLAEAKAAGAVTVNYGLFINTIIAFLIVALSVFVLVRIINRLYGQPAPATPNTKPCPHCTLSIPLAATRCPNCTASLA